MPTGKVKWFNTIRRYGFIIPDEGGGDVFILPKHAQAAGIESLETGQRLSFDYQPSDSGHMDAVNIFIEVPTTK